MYRIQGQNSRALLYLVINTMYSVSDDNQNYMSMSDMIISSIKGNAFPK